MVKKLRNLGYWRGIAVVAALAWMLVLVHFFHTLSSGYEKTAGELVHPYVAVGLQGVMVIASIVLIIFPLQFWIYAVLCCLQGLVHVVEGGSFGGILIYGLGLLFLLKKGFFRTYGMVKLSFAILLLAGAILSQIRYGTDYLTATFLDMLAVSIMALLGALLYRDKIPEQAASETVLKQPVSENIQEQSASETIPEQPTSETVPKQLTRENVQEQAASETIHTAPAMNQAQGNKLLLPKPTFGQRDIKILQSILEGKKYEYIARKNNLSLSSVKKRVRFLYNYFDTEDRASFINTYEGYTVELEADASKE